MSLDILEPSSDSATPILGEKLSPRAPGKYVENDDRIKASRPLPHIAVILEVWIDLINTTGSSVVLASRERDFVLTKLTLIST